MRYETRPSTFSAARLTASLFGVLAALGGMTHGVGEVLQGKVAPEGLFINSWTRGPIATNMGGEPGITVVPNILVSGLLTLLASFLILIWAIFYVPRKNSGRMLIVLSLWLLLVGGGIGPPLIGILAGFAAGNSGRPLSGWRQRLPANVQRLAATLWAWLFALAAISCSFLVVGSLILVYFFDVDNAALFLNTFYVTLISLLLTVLAAPFRDNRIDGQGALIAA